MIQIRDLTKQYGDHKAVDHVSFTVETGEAVGLLGPNGAGKSTTMNMLCGYLEPTEGSIRIDGIDMAEEPLAAKKRIGYLPEVPPLYADMTVEEQLSFACDLRGLPKDAARRASYIDEICARTRLSDMKKRLVRNLSKGYRQRAGLAQLLVGDPKILVLDEPTVGLDPRQIREFRDLILTLAQDHTILLSSHILSEITSVCRRVLVFREGSLIADGEPQKLAESMSGQSVLIAEIEGDPQAARRALSALPGVLSVREAEGSENARRYEIATKPGADIRASVFDAVKDAGLRLLLLRPEEISLESVYLRLTEEGGAPEKSE